MARHASPRRGEVWQVSLDPTVGHEIHKTRPAVIVTNDVYNQHNWVVIALPLTAHTEAEYDQVLILPPEGGLRKASVTLPDQLRAVDRTRLLQRMGRVTDDTMANIDESLRIVLGLS